jgi:hypothetical protein
LFHQNSKWVPKKAEFDADFNSVKKLQKGLPENS